jgi:stearoyl-CoA desaturase (delta-9 desaturase)
MATSTTAPAKPARRELPESVPAEHLTIDRIATVTATIGPFLGLLAVGIFAWDHFLGWSDVIVFTVFYLATGLGITVGFHRLMTHRAFKTKPWVRVIFSALGSMALEGSVIEWVAIHRQHHRYSDQDGDPHSPHLHGAGFRGALQGLWHAHYAWVLTNAEVACEERYAPDLLKDRGVSFINRTFPLWIVVTFAAPFALGFALTGNIYGALTGLLWGGAVRLACLHQATFAINSLCHYFGSRGFETTDESRNLAWLALPTLGESWHNNHHAFPTAAEHGMQRRQLDVSGLVIKGLERIGLAWDVVRISPEHQQRKQPA